MGRQYPDFFRELEHCLDRSKSREENYASLEARYRRVRNQHSDAARQEQPRLTQALKVFGDEASYQAFVRELRAEEKARASRSGKVSAEAERRAVEAQRRARKAEEDQRREAARRRELEQELEDQRRRADEAEERAKQDTSSEHKAGWLDLVLGVAKALTENQSEPPTSPPPYRPQALDLSGDWLTPDGFRCRIAQDGNRVRIQAWDQWGRFIADSFGGFDGNLVQVQFQTVPMPTPWGMRPTQGVATYQVLYGGRRLQGRIVNHVTGSVVDVQLQRAS